MIMDGVHPLRMLIITSFFLLLLSSLGWQFGIADASWHSDGGAFAGRKKPSALFGGGR